MASTERLQTLTTAGWRFWLPTTSLPHLRTGAWLEGFTVSCFDPAKLFTAAVIDQARKHRKRPPDEARALMTIGRLVPAEWVEFYRIRTKANRRRVSRDVGRAHPRRPPAVRGH